MAEHAGGPLAGCRVWVTRPLTQAGPLCERIVAAGAEAVAFPLTEVAPPADRDATRTVLSAMEPGNLCIFVSRNAVRCALELLPSLVNLLARCHVFAVGAGTAAELSGFGIAAVTGPGPAFGSRDLLTLPQLHADAVRGRDIVIVRGGEGEAGLRAELEQRGAIVRYAEVYRRVRPDHDPVAIRHRWQQSPPDVIVITSASAVRTLPELTPEAHRALLLRTPLVVISDRVGAAARDAGFTGAVHVARGASDQGLYETLLEWRKDR